jgi:hypothetical protein
MLILVASKINGWECSSVSGTMLALYVQGHGFNPEYTHTHTHKHTQTHTKTDIGIIEDIDYYTMIKYIQLT